MTRHPCRHLAPLLACAWAFGCAGAGFGGGSELAQRCSQGLDMFENARCQPGQQGQYRVEFLRFELESFQKECQDAQSVQRIAAIEKSCLPRVRQAQAKRADDRRQVRARFVQEVSALLLDPDYPAAADRYKDLQEQAFHADGDPELRAQVEQARSVLGQLARKHGIDPAYAKELELW